MSLRDYKPGDIIHGDCEPFCKTVSIPSQKGLICDGCFNFKAPKERCSLKRCVGCTFMYYCSRDCQKEDWKNGHKIECGSKTFKNSFEDKRSVEFRCQLIRGLAVLKLNPEMATKEFPVFDGTTRCFNDLSTHVKYSESSPIHQVCVQLAQEVTAEGLGHEDLKGNKINILKMAGILATHAFAIYNKGETAKLGLGIYIEPSIFNHSCRPNAKFSTKGTRMEIRALAPIKKGEEPFISFIARHMDKKDRRALLKSRNLDCHCNLCETEEDGAVDYQKLNDLIDFFNLGVAGMPTSNTWKQILAKHEEVIEMMKKIYNEYDDRVTNQYGRVVYTLINLGKCNLNYPKIKEVVDRARIQLKITYGEDHTDYEQFERAVASLH